MNKNLEHILENLVPYLVAGIAIALTIGLLFIFFHVVLWGIVIGGVLWLAVFIKSYFFPDASKKKEEGRIIEHDDN